MVVFTVLEMELVDIRKGCVFWYISENKLTITVFEYR